MTAPTLEAVPSRTPATTALPPLVHSSCTVCTPPKRAFCGYVFKATLSPPKARRTAITCVVCAELDDVHDWAGHLWGQS